MRDLVAVFKALADSTRLTILKLLEKKSMCVCELTKVLNIKQSSVSHHLRILRDAGLVNDIRNGSWIDYELAKKPYNSYAPELLSMLSQWLNDEEKIVQNLKLAKNADRKDLCKLPRS